MNIELRFFASVRVALNSTAESASLPDDVRTVGDVREFLAARGGVWADVLGPDKVLRMACDHKMTGPDTPITEGCEVAFFPPVTGG
ncbi:molybdopterin converting factor subunit 1 [Oxalobacter vibrioformis]|uniref:Molybdopterin converting factor subunit 1 n=1 Tax=Oxalobacter vibrioformis TaxID=933080 RepID=A0A9E9P3J9_9BURK|nr:molybdopterin converting factor subunit 1 [Oxalobacter vibrioformis]WAW10305.1 molybdopterin converting factor subunit 1 [Oxalobacter vibrioformis]